MATQPKFDQTQFCVSCGAQVASGATFCSSCGKPVAVAAGTTPYAATATATTGLTDNLAGMLAYVTIIPAILFLVLEPYSKRKFVRFHAFQCLFFFVACVALGIGVTILGMLPVLGWLTLLLWPLFGLAELIIWVMLLVKAYNGQMWQLPVIGEIAEKQAGSY